MQLHVLQTYADPLVVRYALNLLDSEYVSFLWLYHVMICWTFTPVLGSWYNQITCSTIDQTSIEFYGWAFKDGHKESELPLKMVLIYKTAMTSDIMIQSVESKALMLMSNISCHLKYGTCSDWTNKEQKMLF